MAIERYQESGVKFLLGTAMYWLGLGHFFLGGVFELAGRREEALESLRKAEEMYLEMGVTPDSYWLARTRKALARLDHD
ncbi:MAG: hypothetical protein PHP28_01825 [Actinomycetota bacterium]|nr:hypothetical protein [Actinomycetota bacterium]MDD5668165.1 hypothetical protein [Actinomycetota bacterium]